ncbi:MAG: transglutaminase domain-containing protein [Lachnospiraceae bacterium]|nr:transglutaminase domain-containing protein [Lachnospiraceae bacterium]
MAQRNKKDDNLIELCEGAVLCEDFFEQKEKRILTLLLKGFIVYLLSMGTIGFYLSAIHAEYNVLLCHLVVFVFAILCSMLYYRLLTENLGYFFLFALFASLVYLFRIYINSGFYAIVNMSVDEAAQYFDVDIQRLYNEQITNRYVTITMTALFIGIVLDILLNVYISRRMQYATAMFIVMFFNVIPLYMTLEPDILYAMMLLVGISMAYVIKVSRHYSPQVAIKRSDSKYETRGKKKKEFFYTYDIKALSQAALTVFLFVAIVVTLVSSIRPKESFNVGYKQNKYKEVTMAAVGVFLTDGWAGFFNFGQDKGGMNSGKLGTVSSIKLDYQTDIMIKMTPYSFDTIYLKHFVGESYNPYENYWTSIRYFEDEEDALELTSPEAEALKKNYEDGGVNSAMGIIGIRNVDGDRNGIYEPYYMGEIADYNDVGYINEVFYPRLNGNETIVDSSLYDGEPYTEMDLYVPDENIEAIEEFIQNFDYTGSDEEIIANLVNYYQDNIPYTIKPGKTPRKKDFVNYFLSENKKGYCAHYASAATLILRYLGIPTRYVEGYAVSYYQLSDAELVEGKDFSDYYDGYSELGETAVLQINATDADAHAWIEVYSKDKGWYLVDVTPSGEIEENEDFWEMFDNIMNNNDSDDENDDGGQLNINISDGFVKKVVYVIMGIIAAIVVLLLGIRAAAGLILLIRFLKSGLSDRLIIRYSIYYKRKSKFNKEFKKKINYHEQIQYIYNSKREKLYKKNASKAMEFEKQFEYERIIDILDRAGFSNKEIAREEYDYVCKMLF